MQAPADEHNATSMKFINNKLNESLTKAVLYVLSKGVSVIHESDYGKFDSFHCTNVISQFIS